jgi:DNA invertase Pin-like site-specific DNA recombinase
MNVLKPDKKSTIITLLCNGVSQREISRKTNNNRRTIRKYAIESGFSLASEILDSKYPAEGEVPPALIA